MSQAWAVLALASAVAVKSAVNRSLPADQHNPDTTPASQDAQSAAAGNAGLSARGGLPGGVFTALR